MNGEAMNGNPSPVVAPGPQVVMGRKKTMFFSRRVIFAFVFFILLLIGGITLQSDFAKDVGGANRQEKNYRMPQQSGFSELATSMRLDKMDKKPVEAPQTPPDPATPRETTTVIVHQAQPAAPVLPSVPRYYSNKDDAQAANTLRTLRLQALTAKPVVEDFGVFGRSGGAASSASGSAAPVESGNGTISDAATMAALLGQGAAGQSGQDPNGQGQKLSFLRGSQGGGSMTPQGYSQNLPIPQQFPYELKAGTIIPGLLLTGINSDLPGNVLAQVSENVWDTTGKYVLIPKGTRVIGVYDSQVTYGQRRVLLVWNRLVMPNGMTLDIAGTPGVDQAGYSGLSGRVDEHWGTMLKAALLASVFVAGGEIIYSEDDSTSSSEKKSPRDVAAESLAGSVVDMGTKIVSRAADIQPTITVAPGKKMGIFVQQDVVFPYPYF